MEKDPGVLVDNKMSMGQCVLVAKTASGILGCIRNSIASWSRKGILPLYLAQVRHIWSAGSRSGLLCTRESSWSSMELLEQVDEKATKMPRGLELLSYKDRLRDLGLFSLKKRQLKGVLTNVLKILKRGAKKMEPDSSPKNRTRHNRQRQIAQKGPPEHKEECFYCAGDHILEWATHRS